MYRTITRSPRYTRLDVGINFTVRMTSDLRLRQNKKGQRIGCFDFTAFETFQMQNCFTSVGMSNVGELSRVKYKLEQTL